MAAKEQHEVPDHRNICEQWFWSRVQRFKESMIVCFQGVNHCQV